MPKTWAEIMAAAKIFERTEKQSVTTASWKRRMSAKINGNYLTTEDYENNTWTRTQVGEHSYSDHRTSGMRSAAESRTNVVRGRPEDLDIIFVSQLKKTPKEILLSENVKFPAPPPLNAQSQRDTKKFCDYHKDHGHMTDDSWHLQKQIKTTIEIGKLAHLLKEIKEGPTPGAPRMTGPDPKKVRTLNLVRGELFQIIGDSKGGQNPSNRGCDVSGHSGRGILHGCPRHKSLHRPLSVTTRLYRQRELH
jgi:hypothetical protein